MVELITIIRNDSGDFVGVDVDLTSPFVFVVLLMCVAWGLR